MPAPCEVRRSFASLFAVATHADAFHSAAIAAGGRDNGAPGPREGAGDYYGAFVLDPDGNNIEACVRGAAAG